MKKKYFNPNPKRVQTVSRILNMLALPVLLAAYFSQFFQQPDHSVTDWVIAAVLVVGASMLIAFQERIDRWFSHAVARLGGADCVYEYIKMKIEYLDTEGKRVSFRREDMVLNANYRKDKVVEPIPMESEGGFDSNETSVVNGSLEPLTHKKFKVHHDYKSISEGRQMWFSTVFVNAYKDKTEYLNIRVKNYCKQYSFEIVIPESRKIESRRLLWRDAKAEKSADQRKNNTLTDAGNLGDPWQEVESKRELLTFTYQKSRILVFLEDIHPKIEYRFEWTLSD